MVGEPKDEEARLIGRLLEEDPAVQKEVFRKYDGVMRRRANRVLRDAGAAEDAVQDAWLAVLTRIGDFRGRSAILTWIVAITQNCARNRRRKDRRFVPISTLEPTGCDPAKPEISSDGAPLAINALTPELLLLRREAMRHLETALERLPNSQRSVVLLRDVVGASSAEACRLLAISDAAQRTRLHRGRAMLRRALAATVPRASAWSVHESAEPFS
jgi:RNA polymerase sigma-70 factor (ECF subfamily)